MDNFILNKKSKTNQRLVLPIKNKNIKNKLKCNYKIFLKKLQGLTKHGGQNE